MFEKHKILKVQNECVLLHDTKGFAARAALLSNVNTIITRGVEKQSTALEALKWK